LKIAEPLTVLATIEIAKGSHAAAEPLFQRALTLFGTVPGSSFPSIAVDLANLAELPISWEGCRKRTVFTGVRLKSRSEH
jgi:hypothetical protein